MVDDEISKSGKFRENVFTFWYVSVLKNILILC